MMIRSNVPARIAQIVNHRSPLGGIVLRPEQRIILKRMVEHMVMRLDQVPHAPVMLDENGPGSGKTLCYLLLAMLLAMEGRRSIISTFSIGLREQITSREDYSDAAKARAIIEAAARIFHWSKPRKVTIAALESPTQFFSPKKIEDYHHVAYRGRDAAEWLEFYQSYQNMKTSGDGLIELHEWYAATGGKPLPLSLSSLDLTLDERSDPDLCKVVQARQYAAFEADILVVTHSMLRLLNWRLGIYDTMEKAGKPIKHDCGSYEQLFADECHTIPMMTRSWLEGTIQFRTVRDILKEAPLRITQAMEAFDRLEEFVRDELGDLRTVHVDNPLRFHPLAERVSAFYGALLDVWQVAADHPVYRARLEDVLSELSPIVALDHRTGGRDADWRDHIDADPYPILTRRGSHVAMRLRVGSPARTISALWKRRKEAPNKRQFKNVIMVSGTLRDALYSTDDPYRHFRQEIGGFQIAAGLDHDREIWWYGSPVLSAHTGHGLRIVYPERSKELLPVVATDQARDDFITNREHSAFIAMVIYHIFRNERSKRGANRVLALFVSEEAMMEVYKLLQGYPELGDHVFAQRLGMRFIGRPLTKFRADPFSVVLSMNWQGINATTEDGKSLVDHLLLTKLPIMPLNERRQRDFPHGAASMMYTEAHWMNRQGVGRAARDETARFTLWLGDVRIPLPDELVPPYAKYARDTSPGHMSELYEAFDPISLRFFGRTGSRTGILAGTVTLGYMRRSGDGGIIVTNKEVMLVPRVEDRYRELA